MSARYFHKRRLDRNLLEQFAFVDSRTLCIECDTSIAARQSLAKRIFTKLFEASCGKDRRLKKDRFVKFLVSILPSRQTQKGVSLFFFRLASSLFVLSFSSTLSSFHPHCRSSARNGRRLNYRSNYVTAGEGPVISFL